jgi:hypothetical protein
MIRTRKPKGTASRAYARKGAGWSRNVFPRRFARLDNGEALMFAARRASRRCLEESEGIDNAQRERRRPRREGRRPRRRGRRRSRRWRRSRPRRLAAELDSPAAAPCPPARRPRRRRRSRPRHLAAELDSPAAALCPPARRPRREGRRPRRGGRPRQLAAELEEQLGHAVVRGPGRGIRRVAGGGDARPCKEGRHAGRTHG